MMSLCHCKVFAINLKAFINNLRNFYAKRKELPTFFSDTFNNGMEYIFQCFFKKLNYENGTFFLYRENNTTSSESFPYLTYNTNLRALIQESRDAHS